MKFSDQEHSALPSGTTLFRFNGVPIVAQPGFWPYPFLITGLLAWIAGRRHPGFSWLQRLGEALLAAPVGMFADVGHAMAHTVSARLANAPMDEILLSSEMPRTLYANNAVPPRTHIQRSLGGPIFSLAGTLLSLLWWRTSPRGSIRRDLAEASLAGHSFILLGSLAPLPMVDGGIVLKWKLVESGQSPAEAERTVRRLCLGLGGGLIGSGAWLGLAVKRRLAGGLLAAAGAAAVAGGLGWIK